MSTELKRQLNGIKTVGMTCIRKVLLSYVRKVIPMSICKVIVLCWKFKCFGPLVNYMLF